MLLYCLLLERIWVDHRILDLLVPCGTGMTEGFLLSAANV